MYGELGYVAAYVHLFYVLSYVERYVDSVGPLHIQTHSFIRQLSHKSYEFHKAHNFILHTVTVLQTYCCSYFYKELGTFFLYSKLHHTSIAITPLHLIFRAARHYTQGLYHHHNTMTAI
jgi:hypothetical protein